jgi:hypothetical protein
VHTKHGFFAYLAFGVFGVWRERERIEHLGLLVEEQVLILHFCLQHLWEVSVVHYDDGFLLAKIQPFLHTANNRHDYFAKRQKRQMPNKPERGCYYIYIVPIHLLLSLYIIIIIYKGAAFFLFLIWRLANWRRGRLLINKASLLGNKAPLLKNKRHFNHHSKKICFFIENNWIIVWIFDNYFVTLQSN